jgi:hypothetical protein
MDLTTIGYLLFIVPGFCLVWTYRHFTKAEKIGDFEYAIWSFLWGSVLLILIAKLIQIRHILLPSISMDEPILLAAAFLGMGLAIIVVLALPLGYIGALLCKLRLFEWIDKKLFWLIEKLPSKAILEHKNSDLESAAKIVSSKPTKYLSEILLLLVIPLLTFGFNLFARTSIYDNLIGLKNLEELVQERFLGIDYAGQSRGGLILPDENEFSDLWDLIKRNSSAEVPRSIPQLIGRFTTENAPYTEVPASGSLRRVYLIPDSIPIAALYCSGSELSSCKESTIIGTAGDFKGWIQNTRNRFELNLTLFISLLSIIAGFISLIFKSKSQILQTKTD